MTVDLQEERLGFWDRLIRGEPVIRDEVDRAIAVMSRDASEDERTATILLLAAVVISNSSSRAMRQYLRAALLYWFSQSGAGPDSADRGTRQMKNPGLVEVMGLRLTWPESLRMSGVRLAGGKGVNYVAFSRLQQCLRERMAEEWTRVFGSKAPEILTPRG